MRIHTLDLEYFRGETIAAYLVESAGHFALVETGPDSTWPHLVAALAKHGAQPSDVKDVLVTHIHLDHAGAAWRLARAGSNVWVHPRGAPHMADPSKLLASAKRIYKEQMDTLWGTLEPIPADRLKVTEDGLDIPVGDARIRVLETPGHAIHPLPTSTSRPGRARSSASRPPARTASTRRTSASTVTSPGASTR